MASSMNRNIVREPTASELLHLHSVLDVLSWALLDGDGAIGLLAALGADIDAAVHEVAGIDPEDFVAAFGLWTIGPELRHPTAMEKGRARAFHRACRIVAELEWSSAETDAWNWSNSQAASAAAAARTSAVLAAGIAATPTPKPPPTQVVKVSEVADVTKTSEAPVLDDEAIKSAFKQYERKMWTEPRPEQEPTVDQLSALAHLLSQHCCYVDLSIWGPHGMRILKQMKVSGLIMSAGGEFIHHEFKGPPSIEHWLACWEVFMAGMIMLDACAPPFLLAYGALIAHYAKRYGPQCWALIYQVETRFRREQMERARRRASNELDAAILNNASHEFNPARPWEFVFKRAAGDTIDQMASRYWHLYLEEPCLLIVAGARRADGFIDGDAAVCSSGSGHMATQGSPGFSLHDTGASSSKDHRKPVERRPPAQAQPAKRRAVESTPRGKQEVVGGVVVDGHYVNNRRGHSLCHAFNKGTCEPSTNNAQCPKNPEWRHLCSKCLASNHGAHLCKEKSPDGKPKFSGGKGGRRK
jgi:hypothetical protein